MFFKIPLVLSSPDSHGLYPRRVYPLFRAAGRTYLENHAHWLRGIALYVPAHDAD